MATTTRPNVPRGPVRRSDAASAPTCSTAELYEDAIRAGEGLIAADGPARRPHRQAHRPLAAGQVHRPRAVERRQDLVGRRSTSRSARQHYDRLRARLVAYVARARPVRPGLLHRRRTRITAARLRVYTETAWASIFARNLFRRPHAPTSSPASSRTSRSSTCPSFKADPETEGTRTETAILRPPQADGDHHRRHRVRRRDQEVARSRS